MPIAPKCPKCPTCKVCPEEKTCPTCKVCPEEKTCPTCKVCPEEKTCPKEKANITPWLIVGILLVFVAIFGTILYNKLRSVVGAVDSIATNDILQVATPNNEF
jgi:hypothetical protein